MAQPLDKKKPAPAWVSPPLDWRKFDDPCSPRSRREKIRNRLGGRPCQCLPDAVVNGSLLERRQWWLKNCGSLKEYPEHLRCYFKSGLDKSE